jgi:hypothetical protein
MPNAVPHDCMAVMSGATGKRAHETADTLHMTEPALTPTAAPADEYDEHEEYDEPAHKWVDVVAIILGSLIALPLGGAVGALLAFLCLAYL